MRSGHLSTRLSSARRGSPYIVCWILRSSSKEDFLKSEAIRFGWGRHCDHLEYIDRGTPGIMADWEEGHKHIAGKSFRAWQFIDEKYVRDAERTGNRTVDFAVKADTDTYIIGDHLREYLNRFDPDLPHYIGKQLMHAEGYPMVAGTAIILSRAALRIFAKASYKSAGKCTWEGWFPGAEDVALALCLREHGVYPHDTKDANGAERFMVLNPNKLLSTATPLPEWYVKMSMNKEAGKACCSPDAIAFHHVTLKQLNDEEPKRIDGEWSWIDLSTTLGAGSANFSEVQLRQ